MNKMKMMQAAFAVVMVAGLVSTASASSKDYEWSYSANDFASPGAVKRLHSRMLAEAREHCPSYRITRDLRGARSCVGNVLNDMVRKIDHPLLNAYVEGEDDALDLAFANRQRHSSGG